MLYIIGLGLNEESLTQEGLKAIKECKEIYLENYTVEFPYDVKELEKTIKKKLLPANRDFVENFRILEIAKRGNVALLIYGSPLTATTHISLIQEAKKQKIECKVIQNASILDAIAETGLQLYKFGKTTSLPNFEADSFIDIVKDNQKINAHSLILVDIGMKFKDAVKRLEEASKRKNLKIGKIVVCSRLGTKEGKIAYGTINELKDKEIAVPFCLIILGRLHFMEEEALDGKRL
jgi:diphthine synthase